MPNVKPRRLTHCCIISGVITMAFGIFIVTFVPIFLKKMVHANFAIDSPAAKGFPSFLQIPKSQATIYQSFYIYNITNPDALESGAEGPKVTEHGPYTYRMDKQRMVDTLAWKADGTVQYIQHTVFTFIPEMSKGSESDIYTVPNLGYIGALNKVRNSPDLLKLINAVITDNNIPLFIKNNLTVAQILWGYKNTLLEKLYPIVSSPIVQMQVKNDFNDVILPAAMKAGGEDMPYDSLRSMTMWNGMDKYLTYWNSSYANMINGTDGTSFHPYLSEDEIDPAGTGLPVFSDTIFRSAFLVDCGKKSKDGVKLWCVKMRDEMLLNGDHNPNNKAFFMTSTGLIPFPKAVGKPIHVSLPHFFQANLSDPLLAKVQYPAGTVASHETCDTILCIEPFSGQLLDAHKRLQINTLFEPNITVPGTTTATYVPLIWVDQFPIVTTEAIDSIKLKIYLPYYGSLTLGPFLIALGLFLIIFATVRCTCCSKPKGEDELYHSLGGDEINRNSYKP